MTATAHATFELPISAFYYYYWHNFPRPVPILSQFVMTASTDAACSVVETYDDPDQPCSRPASVLSGSDSDSDLGNVSDDYDWGEDALGPPNEWISKRIARNIMRRDGFCCLVCGLEERLQLTVVRAVAQHADHDLTAQVRVEVNPYCAVSESFV